LLNNTSALRALYLASRLIMLSNKHTKLETEMYAT